MNLRLHRLVSTLRLDEDQILLTISVDSAAPARLGTLLARIDDATGAVIYQVTGTDVPCQLTSESRDRHLAPDAVRRLDGSARRGSAMAA